MGSLQQTAPQTDWTDDAGKGGRPGRGEPHDQHQVSLGAGVRPWQPGQPPPGWLLLALRLALGRVRAPRLYA